MPILSWTLQHYKEDMPIIIMMITVVVEMYKWERDELKLLFSLEDSTHLVGVTGQ